MSQEKKAPYFYELDDEGSSMGWISIDRSPLLAPQQVFRVMGDSAEQADRAEKAVKAINSFHDLLAALKHIEGLEARADSCVGFVDNPHMKAFRSACLVARNAIAEVEKP